MEALSSPSPPTHVRSGVRVVAPASPPPPSPRAPQVVSKAMGNDLYDKSDHKWMLAEVLMA